MIRLYDGSERSDCPFENGLGQRVFGGALSDGRGLNYIFRIHAGNRDYLSYFRIAERQRSGLIENHGVHLAQRFEIQAALDDGALMGRAADCAEYRERRTGGDTASSGDDDDRDGGAGVVCDEECEYSGGEGKVTK